MHVLPLGFDHQRDGGNVYHDGDYHDDDEDGYSDKGHFMIRIIMITVIKTKKMLLMVTVSDDNDGSM